MCNSTRGDTRVTGDDLRKSHTEVCRNNDFLLNLMASNRPIIHCLDAPAPYSIDSLSSLTFMPPAVSRSRAVNFQNSHGPPLSCRLRLRLKFLSFFSGTLLPDKHRIVERELVTMHSSASYPRICALCLTFWHRNYFFNFSTSCI